MRASGIAPRLVVLMRSPLRLGIEVGAITWQLKPCALRCRQITALRAHTPDITLSTRLVHCYGDTPPCERLDSHAKSRFAHGSTTYSTAAS